MQECKFCKSPIAWDAETNKWLEPSGIFRELCYAPYHWPSCVVGSSRVPTVPTVPIHPAHSQAVKKLIKLGVIPSESVQFDLHLRINEIIRATVTYNVTEEQLQQIADVFAAHPEETARFAQELIFQERHSGRSVKTNFALPQESHKIG